MLPQLLRLLNVRREFLDALVSETAVKSALQTDPQVEIFGPGLWAVRQRAARRHNPKIREPSPPRLWTWRAITPHSPQSLPPSDQAVLAQLALSLHGLLISAKVDDAFCCSPDEAEAKFRVTAAPLLSSSES
ncbi:hypothetical protein [Deinococcus ruber]|uniref:Uncharacterized protein n=1 Tax=Deinococcus ruber TaxID=1848197 RepID=A0A918CDT3_9DEIO|nr:hypothetical protein [Deinococcus ruber]GGR17563.1 hypothetical protein GCM10008957_32910 [Deinococcus ruber]